VRFEPTISCSGDPPDVAALPGTACFDIDRSSGQVKWIGPIPDDVIKQRQTSLEITVFKFA
jgi:hypothetical protein